MVNFLLIRRPYVLCSDHFRHHVDHLSSSQIADAFLIKKRTVDRILQRYEETGQTNKKQQGGYKPKL